MSWPPTKEEWERLKQKMLEPPEPPMYFVSPKAYDMALKILDIEPKTVFCGEASIWAKAHALGILKEPK